MIEHALAYACKGWPVFPVHHAQNGVCSCGHDCGSPAKHPMTRNGLKDATTDLDRLERWWTRHPDSNIGLVTGVKFDVFDIDNAGDLTADQIHGISTMDGPSVITGGAGMHCYVLPTGLGNRAKFLPGCDWRGTGGYVLAPPSTHISGQKYEWMDGYGPDTIIRPCPQWLILELNPPRRPTELTKYYVTKNSVYAATALENEIANVAYARQGTRNDTLNTAAFNMGTLVGAGLLNGPEVAAALVNAAMHAGLGEKEALATVQSGLKNGVEHPRRVT